MKTLKIILYIDVCNKSVYTKWKNRTDIEVARYNDDIKRIADVDMSITFENCQNLVYVLIHLWFLREDTWTLWRSIIFDKQYSSSDISFIVKYNSYEILQLSTNEYALTIIINVADYPS